MEDQLSSVIIKKKTMVSVKWIPWSYLMLFGSFLIAINAAIDLMSGVGQLKLMDKLLLHGGDTTGIFAFQNTENLFRKGQSATFGNFSVPDDIHSDAGVDVTQHIEIDVHDLINLDDIFATHFGTGSTFNHGYGAVQIAQLQNAINLCTAAGGDMVQNDPVFDLSDDHTFTSKSFRISAARIYFPFST